jgi:hypothetical protein
MLFEVKKFELQSAEDLLQCRINTVKPYALMPGPVYVFMKRNEKYVSVKAPLDFFTPDELFSFERYEMFYLPKAVSEVSGFQTSARLVRSLIGGTRKPFPPAPYEVSDEVLKVLAPVWGKTLEMSPFCAAIFTDELCGSLAPDELIHGRDTTVARHDLGLLLSGFLVFVLVHLGWLDCALLERIRTATYSRTIRGEDWGAPKNEWEAINRDLIGVLDARSSLTRTALESIPSEWAMQLLGRLERVSKLSAFFDSSELRIASGGFSW